MNGSRPRENAPRLSDIIRAKKGEILAAWERSVRRMQPAEHLSPPALLDHMPPFLLDLAAKLEAHDDVPAEKFPRLHALSRLALGYDLKTVVAEYGALRACLVDVAARQVGPEERETELPLLHAFLDEAISASVDRYAWERERTLRALDRISEAALDEEDVPGFLQRLLDVLSETVEAVDTGRLLLVEGEDGALVQRASIGPPGSEGERVGEGLAGRIARDRRPILVPFGATDPHAPDAPPSGAAAHAWYGLPLMHREQLIGVAIMGSRSAYEFSAEDQLLFRTLAARATGIIVQGQLLERERRHDGQRAELAAEVERQRSRLEAMLAMLPVGVVLRDARTLEVTVINEAARRIYGKYIELVASPEDYAREPLLDAEGAPVPHEELPLMRTLRGELVERQLLRVPLEPPRIVEVAAAPIRAASGEIVATVLTLVDVSESKQLEAELRSALDFRDRILGVLSHDLRNPLGVIKMSAGALMRASDLNERHLRGLSRIDVNADRIARMIHDLLDYTRARLGAGIPVVPRATNLHHLCQQVIESMEVLHPSRSFRFTVSGNTRGEWDPDRVLQAIQNLVTNAILYSPESSPVTLTLKDQREVVELTVHNEGEPIPPALLDELFEPFRSTGSVHADGGRGLGLGLYIVRELVEAHGGSVAVRSGQGSGTSFIVRFPRR